ncbi:tyrosine-type recombinase/integrase [Nonomuraea endophytica]|uniref:tyrosine-type recombinase/integrase n=1 Tax=Nonomuraea endophytica TaxID=714136 RepID=UPI0037CC4A8B
MDSGFVFTDEIGRPLHPQQVSDQFYLLAFQVGLPPVRLHDLRHGAATLMLAAGVDVKIVQETLGRASSTFTRDTYTSVYPELAKAAAESTAALVNTAARNGPGSSVDQPADQDRRPRLHLSHPAWEAGPPHLGRARFPCWMAIELRSRCGRRPDSRVAFLGWLLPVPVTRHRL